MDKHRVNLAIDRGTSQPGTPPANPPCPGPSTEESLDENAGRPIGLTSLLVDEPAHRSVDDLIWGLIRLRRAAGVSQHEMTRRTGISQANLSRVERGHAMPGVETVAKMAAALGYRLTLVPLD